MANTAARVAHRSITALANSTSNTSEGLAPITQVAAVPSSTASLHKTHKQAPRRRPSERPAVGLDVAPPRLNCPDPYCDGCKLLGQFLARGQVSRAVAQHTPTMALTGGAAILAKLRYCVIACRAVYTPSLLGSPQRSASGWCPPRSPLLRRAGALRLANRHGSGNSQSHPRRRSQARHHLRQGHVHERVWFGGPDRHTPACRDRRCVQHWGRGSARQRRQGFCAAAVRDYGYMIVSVSKLIVCTICAIEILDMP